MTHSLAHSLSCGLCSIPIIGPIISLPKRTAVISGIITSGLWLLSSSFGIRAMGDLGNEWPIVIAYLLAVGLGVYLGMDFSNYLNKK